VEKKPVVEELKVQELSTGREIKDEAELSSAK